MGAGGGRNYIKLIECTSICHWESLSEAFNAKWLELKPVNFHQIRLKGELLDNDSDTSFKKLRMEN